MMHLNGKRCRSFQAIILTIILCWYMWMVVTTSSSKERTKVRVVRLKSADIFQNKNHVSDVDESNDIDYVTSDNHTRLEDLFISVKTSYKYHRSRLDVILKTWYNLAADNIFFFTDAEDSSYRRRTNGHLINTNCSSSHHRQALCCKLSVEFDYYLDSNKKWFCHFDDDNYVNVPALVRMLNGYNPQQDWYLGKNSILKPFEMITRLRHKERVTFWFATGGAGFCISRALALKMIPHAGGGKLMSIGEGIRMPDDVTMGYIIERLLRKRLTVVKEFHSHLESLAFLKKETFADQISFSYNGKNTIMFMGGFNQSSDPTRFLSLHCFLYPNFSFCPPSSWRH